MCGVLLCGNAEQYTAVWYIVSECVCVCVCVGGGYCRVGLLCGIDV